MIWLWSTCILKSMDYAEEYTYILTINNTKTNIMKLTRQQEQQKPSINIQGTDLEYAKEFVYLEN